MMVETRSRSRYRQLLAIFWRNTLATEMEYRVNFWSNLVLSAFWLGWAALGIRVYFRFTISVRGWTYAEMLIVVGLFFALNGVRQALITPNLARMTEYVRDGTLDFLLTKPVNSQFMVSFRHIGVFNWLDPVLGLALAFTGLIATDRPVTAASVALFLGAFLAAIVILYAVSLAMMSLSLRSVSSEGVDDMLQGLVETSRLPVQIYRGALRTLFSVVLPVALFTTVPTQVALGQRGAVWVALAAGVAIVANVVASGLWRVALRGYTGASGVIPGVAQRVPESSGAASAGPGSTRAITSGSHRNSKRSVSPRWSPSTCQGNGRRPRTVNPCKPLRTSTPGIVRTRLPSRSAINIVRMVGANANVLRVTNDSGASILA